MSKEKTTVTKEKAINIPKKEAVKSSMDFAFGRINYILMIAGIVLLLAGYMLMAGGGSKDPKVFNPEIFSFRRISLAPIVIILGYIVEIFAIVIKPKD